MPLKVILYSRFGSRIDSFTAPDEDAAREELANLLRAEWLLMPGDTVKVEETDQILHLEPATAIA